MLLLNKNTIQFYGLIVLTVLIGSCKKESAFQIPSKPIVLVNSNDNRFKEKLIHFVKDSVYVLGSSITIDSGKVFVLDAGTVVKVNTTVFITIQEGAQIEAKGTSGNPIVFTGNADKGKGGISPSGGTWDGIRIFGSAGGASSGILNYVRIEFAGVYNSALLFSGVSQSTTISNIQVSFSYDRPSFEFRGGNCNASNLLSYASAGTDFFITNGYTGNLQNLLSYRHPFFGTGFTLAGMDIEGSGTQPAISNLTVIGPSSRKGIKGDYLSGSPFRRAALITSGGAKFHLINSVLIGFPGKAYSVDDRNTALSLQAGESELMYTVINPVDTANAFYLPGNVYPPYNSNDLKNFLSETRFHNETILNFTELQLGNPYNYFEGIPDPVPVPNSLLLTGANFDNMIFKDPFFKKVSYRGALGMENWLRGWVNFAPLETDYNN